MADKEGIYFDEIINNRLRGVSRMASLEIILERAEKAYTEEEKEQERAQEEAEAQEGTAPKGFFARLFGGR